MTTQKPPQLPTKSKKSETLEVRIPFETKQAFLTACREDGTTASEVVRDKVQSYLDERERPPAPEKRSIVMKLPQPIRRYGLRAAAGAAVAVGFTAMAVLPSAAQQDFMARFKALDKNGDGVLSSDEFLGPKDDDGDKDVVVETRTITRNTKGDAPPPMPAKSEMKQEAFSFWLPDELGGAKGTEQHAEYKFVSHSEVKTSDGDKPETHTLTISVDDIRQKEFEAFDTNKDGKISSAEFSARERAMLTRGFEILDANNDKSLTQAEYAKIVSPPVIRLGGPDTPEPPQVDMPGMKKVSPEAIKAAFTRLDVNKDGKLSLQEYLPPA